MKIKNQQGASVLEFIIIIPVLLMFILLVSEVGILFYTLNALNKSTQDAARYLSKEQSEFLIRKPIAINLLKYGNVTGSGSPLLPDGNTKIIVNKIENTTLGSTHVTVEVSYQHDLIMGPVLGALTSLNTGGGVGFSDSFTLQASSVMRFE